MTRDNRIAERSPAIHENHSGPHQSPAVRPDNQLAAGSTLIQENCSGTTLVGSGNHVHYHFHLHCDTCDFHAEHTEHRQWAEHHMEALGRGLQQLQLPPCDNNKEEVSEEELSDDEEEAVKSAKTTGDIASNHCDSKVSSSPETSRVSITEDTFSIIDSNCQVLEPGDAVWTEMFGHTRAVNVGHQDIVLCQESDMRVVKERLDLTQPFGKLRVIRGECSLFPRGEVIRRAESRVGAEFTEGNWCAGLDFPYRAISGLGADQAFRRGFWLDF